jgi:hypothetical protein
MALSRKGTFFGACFASSIFFLLGLIFMTCYVLTPDLTCDTWNPNDSKKDEPKLICTEIQNFSNCPQSFQDNGRSSCYCASIVDTIIKPSCHRLPPNNRTLLVFSFIYISMASFIVLYLILFLIIIAWHPDLFDQEIDQHYKSYSVISNEKEKYNNKE